MEGWRPRTTQSASSLEQPPATERLDPTCSAISRCVSPACSSLLPDGRFSTSPVEAVSWSPRQTGRSGRAGSAVGVDLTPEMIAEARMGQPSAQFAVMDAHALGFAADTFDAAVCNFALTYFADPRRALTECVHVARPGGRFGLVVHDGWWWHDDPRWAWHARLLADFGSRYAAAPRRFNDPAAVARGHRTRRFHQRGRSSRTFALHWRDPNDWWDWCWSHGYRVVLESFDTAALGAFRAACFSHLASNPIEGTLPVILVTASAGSEDLHSL